MSHLRVAVLVLCFVIASVLCSSGNDVTMTMDEEKAKIVLQTAKDKMDEADGNGDGSKSDQKGGDRKKRQVFYNGGFGGYNYYPSYNRLVGNGFLRDEVYDPVNYLGRLPYLPDASLSRFNSLPIFRFFDQFYPAGITRGNNVLVRNYLRLGAGFSEARTDFRALPVYNVREIAATTVSNFGPDLEADIFGIDGGRVSLRRRGCALRGFNNVGLPCIVVRLRSQIFGDVYRRFTYLQGLDTGLGPNGVYGGAIFAK